LSGKSLSAAQAFARWITELSDRAIRGDTLAALRDLIKTSHYESWLYDTSSRPKAAEIAMANISTLFSWISDMLEGSELEPPMTLQDVVNRLILRDMLERGEDNEDGNQVQLMTLHAAKGLEFRYVYIIGVEEGLLPHQSSIDQDSVEEERRLMYVGITRAQQELTLSMVKARRQFGENQSPEPSRFLFELPQDDIEWEHKKQPVSEAERQQQGDIAIANIRAMLEKK
jgi:ATP-dependent DNA helicase Rep